MDCLRKMRNHKLLSVINSKNNNQINLDWPPPIWMMRQAGRYLPEYRQLRSKANGFLDFCYNPELVIEATLQPIHRFDFDAAIIFSDILVIPDALGRDVRFEENIGPLLNPMSLDEVEGLYTKMDKIESHLNPVFDAMTALHNKLADKALIGFAGSPWTLACYMICGGNINQFQQARIWAYQYPEKLSQLIDCLSDAIILYLRKKIDAGADIIQLFDSWAGLLDEKSFYEFVIKPHQKIITSLRKTHKDTPITAFPRGAGVLYEDFVIEVKPDVIQCDGNLSYSFIAEKLAPHAVIQGNLDPLRLFSDKTDLAYALDNIYNAFSSHHYIFNLSHGIDKNSDPDKVLFMVDYIRKNFK